MRLKIEGGKKKDLGKSMQSSGIPCFTPVWDNQGTPVKEEAVVPEKYGHPFPFTDGGGGAGE